MIHFANFNSILITRRLTSARTLVSSELACSKTKKRPLTQTRALINFKIKSRDL